MNDWADKLDDIVHDFSLLCDDLHGPGTEIEEQECLRLNHDLSALASEIRANAGEVETLWTIIKAEVKKTDPEWVGEHCKRCGRAIYTVWGTDPETWADVVGEEICLCLDCFAKIASEKGICVPSQYVTLDLPLLPINPRTTEND